MEKAKVLSKLIDEKGYSKRKFADEIGIPPTTLQSILTRGVGKAAVDTVIKICKGLGITTEQLDQMSNDEKEISFTLAAHHDGEEWTKEELEEIETFKEFVKMKRKGE